MDSWRLFSKAMMAKVSAVSLAIFSAGLVANCSSNDENVASTGEAASCETPGVAHKLMFPTLRFDLPIGMAQVPGDNSRFFVLEHGGRIKDRKSTRLNSSH